MKTVSIVIADDHPFVLSGICDFLKSANDIEIAATCANGTEALEKIRELKPDVAILDATMPEMSGFEVLTAARRETLSTRFLFLSAFASPRDVIDAMAEGAYGYLQKDSKPAELLRCVREIADGRKCIPYELFGRVQETNALGRPVETVLTQREWKVMSLAAKGKSNKEIARQLNIAAGTAKIHLHHIFRKIGVRNRTALAAMAFRDERPEGNVD